ncbi:membrane-associated 30 kDa protein, chloroplastic [Actinidia eriantha]|uniref:membrane-associated 30 kDa protein, chloroplastic n=1 Tax=Actinidia eriantha TaxID=165200 RepID=UPI002582619E|nr:membrane-associated 30 kDa protein, chloroplastic [Actinidia eriantha]
MALKAPITGLSMASTPSASLQSPSSSRFVIVRASIRGPSFIGNGVGASTFLGTRLRYPDRLRCNGYGGGVLGARMNLFDRFARVIKSYANAILSTFEDPEKILEQSVLEMNDDLTKMRQATAQVLASQKQLENKYKAAQQASEDWYKRAQLALGKGEEDLAREALKRRKAYADNANALRAQLDQQKSIVDNLVSNTRLLESKIQEAKSKKDTLKARAQSAKTATKVSEMLGNVNTSSALSAFEKMEEKVLAMESQAEALNQLTTDDLEGKFALLESSSVDDDLANLKKELSGSTLKGELPPGRTSARSTSSAFPFQDSEIERELNELRRKAKDF